MSAGTEVQAAPTRWGVSADGRAHVLHYLPAARTAPPDAPGDLHRAGPGLGVGLVVTVAAASAGVKKAQSGVLARCTGWAPT